MSRLSQHATPFDAAACDGAVPQDLPEQVTIGGSRDIEVARRVHRSPEPDADPLGRLRLWRKASVAARQERRRRLLGTTTRWTSARPESGPRKVLFVSVPSAFSGAEQSVLGLVRKIDRTRFEPVFLVGAEGVLTRRLREAGARVISPGTFTGDTAEDSFYLGDVIRRTRPHVLHVNAPSGPVPMLAPVFWGTPVVTHLRTADTGGYEAQLKASDAIIAVSDFVRREALRLEIPEGRVHLVYNGVDTEAFRPNALGRLALRKKFGIPEGAKVTVMIARFVPSKRHDVVLEAARLAKRRVPNLFLVLNGEVFGESPAYDSARAFIAAHRMGNWVRIIPFLEDIREIHSVADLLVLCSEREPLARCVIEAMSMEVPVIVTNSGGLPEAVHHCETGFVVPAGDAPALADQISNALAAPDLCRRVARAASRHVEQHFDAALSAQRVMRVYDKVLSEGR